MSPVDDVILNNKAPNKKGKGILVILFLLFLVLLMLIGGYWYFINYMQETPKTVFFKYVGQNNLSNILNIDIYYAMLEKMNNESNKTETTANITTSMENDLIKSVDISKLEFIINTSSDKENEASLLDGKITYSSNDIFNVKVINNKDNIGIGSSEIFDKYIATAKTEFSNSINRATGQETDISADVIDETINNFLNNKVVMENGYRTDKINQYSNILYNSIPEEAVQENENVIVTIDSKAINAKAYTLTLDSELYKQVLSNVLNELKNDSELLEKIVTGTEANTESKTEIKDNTKENSNDTNMVTNPLTNVQVQYTGAETEEHQTMQEENTNELQLIEDLPDENLVKNENTIITDTIEEEVISEDESKLFENLILAFVLNQKIETTKDDLLKDINAEINNLNEGIQITVYVRNEEEQAEETIKLVIQLPNNINVDVEYKAENKIKITTLEEVTEEEETITQGNSIEMEKTSSDIKTEYSIKISDIRNKEVIAKTQIDVDTEGSKSSKTYTNEIILKHNNSEGDFKLNIKNNIDFENVAIEETLNNENAIFVDKLADEEVNTLYTQITEKMMQVFSEKIISLAFIDNNLSSSVIQQPVLEQVNEQEKNGIRQKLIETVSNMMGQAELSGETFTIQNLKDIQIEGLNVSCMITEELATIKINGYTFMIDKNFVLSE